MGLFNPKLQETSGSAVTPKQAPVKANIVAEVANTVGKVSSIFSEVGVAKQQGELAGFNQDLVRLSSAVNQGKMSKQSAATTAKTLHAQAILANPALAKEFNAAYKGVSGVTDAFTVEDTEQQRLVKKINDKMVAEGRLDGTETEQQLVGKRKLMAKEEMAKADLASLKANLEYKTAKGAEERRAATEERKTTSDNATKDFIEGRGEAFTTQVNALYSDITKGTLEPSEGLIQIQQMLSGFTTEVNGSGTESKDLANNLMKPYTDLVETYKAAIQNPADATYYENKVKSTLAKSKSVILSNPQWSHVVAASNLLGNTAVGALVTNKAVLEMFSMNVSKGTTGKGRYSDVVGGEGGGDYLDLVKKSTAVFNSKGTPEDQTGAITELGYHINGILKSVDVHRSSVERPEEYNKLTDFLASPEYALAVKGGLVDDVASGNAKEVLQQQYVSVLMPLVKDKMHKTFATHTGVIQGFGDTEVNIEDAVNIEFTSSGIVFRAKENLPMELKRGGSYTKMLQELNSTVGKQMNKMIRMDAHLSGSVDYKSIAEQTVETLMGREQEQQDTQQATQPELTPEYLNTQEGVGDLEDGTYEYEGKRITVEGGKVTGVQ